MAEENQPTTPVEEKGQLPTEPKTVEAPPLNVAAKEGKKEDTPRPIDDGKKEAPPPKTYTEEEVTQRIATIKGGHEGTISKMKNDLASAVERAETIQRQLEEREYARLIQSTEDSGGDVDSVKTMIEREKSVAQKERDMVKRSRELEELKSTLNEAGRTKQAHDLIKTHELNEDMLEELLNSEDPLTMENKALKLRLEKGKAEARQPEKPERTPPSTRGQDVNKMSISRRLGLSMEGEL